MRYFGSDIPAPSYPTNRIRLLYDINVHGAFFCAREAARHMLDKNTKGSIVLVSSMSANVSGLRHGAYQLMEVFRDIQIVNVPQVSLLYSLDLGPGTEDSFSHKRPTIHPKQVGVNLPGVQNESPTDG